MSSSYQCSECGSLEKKFGQELKAGKRALTTQHRKLVRGHADCSLNVETAMAEFQNEGERIFDYLLITKECESVFVEVHPARADQVKVVVQKQEGTKSITKRAGHKKVLKDARWHWVPTGSVAIKPGADKYTRQLLLAGIQLARNVEV